MKAAILAGGKGTRLAKLIKNTPKPLIKISGKPVIEHQILLLRKYGIKEIWFLLGYFGDSIRQYFGNGKKWDVNIHYCQEKKPLGTAGALKVLEDEIKGDFLVFSGDVIMNFDLKRFIDYHRQKKGIASIVVHPNNHPFDSDLVEVDKEGQIISLLKRPHPPGLIFRNLSIASVYIFSPKVFKYIPLKIKSDIEKDIFPLILKSKAKIYTYNSPEYFKDIGTPERLFKARRDYAQGKIERLNLKQERKAIFLDRDGVINEEVDQLCKVKDLKIYDFAAKAIKKINEIGNLAIIISNQPMIAKGFMTENDLNEIHKKLETELGKKGAKIDAIYYCPHHPEKGFVGEISKLKINCKCRKPEIGLFLKAKKDFNIDLKNSYSIGDKTSDILAGKRAGCKTILVKTGYGGKDDSFSINPDFVAKNLLEAVKIVYT
jgi:D,D-heptose 1,7-bisphosphate phosphatase